MRARGAHVRATAKEAGGSDVAGGGGVDKFRIKIRELADESIVYDNQMGEDDDSEAATELGGGSIVIHEG